MQSQPANLTNDAYDPVLGTLRRSSDTDWWMVKVAIGGKTIGFEIGGDDEPNARLLAHARDIVRAFPDFERMIAAFLNRESERMKGAAHEIQQLSVEDVCLVSPGNPHDGLIYFKGPDEFRLWRCDYTNRQPCALTFDR